MAIERALKQCEYDKEHKQFISYKTQKNYVEAHHLIPLKYENDFDYSIDILPNIVSLCVICHKKLHHGIFGEKKELIRYLFNERIESLKLKGIDISLEQLYSYYNQELDDEE